MSSKLPTGFVKKASAFDSPLRRTAPDSAAVPSAPVTELRVVEDAPSEAPVAESVPAPVEAGPDPVFSAPVASASEGEGSMTAAAPVAGKPAPVAAPRKAPTATKDKLALSAQFSTRFTDAQYRALHEACYRAFNERGVRVGPAEMVRNIVDEWMRKGSKLP